MLLSLRVNGYGYLGVFFGKEIDMSENKYIRVVHDNYGNKAYIDVYDILKAFNVTCPALQHLIKKALCAGIRGHKDISTDLNDILISADRAVQLNLVEQNKKEGK